MAEFLNPRVAISFLIICIFAWSFGENVDDDTMKGAIIGALNIAVGYWLGSSNSSNQVREQVGKALDLAAANAPETKQADIELKPGEKATVGAEPAVDK